MAQVFSGGVDGLDYLLYPQQSQSNLEYFRNSLENITQSFADYGSQFVDSAKEIYNRFNSSEVLEKARKLLRNVGSNHNNDYIRELTTIEEIQQAKPSMQRWLMANIETREKYQQQLLDGYSDTYTDMHPGDIGFNHYDYRMVTNGMINSEDHSWYEHFDELLEGDRELTIGEKSDIINTWDLLKSLVGCSMYDPTDPANGTL